MKKIIRNRTLPFKLEYNILNAYTLIISDTVNRFRKLRGDDISLCLSYYGRKNLNETQIDLDEKESKKSQCITIDSIRDFTDTLAVQPDVIDDITTAKHIDALLYFLEKLYQEGDIYIEDYKGHYCPECERYLAENEYLDKKCLEHNVFCKIDVSKSYSFKLERYGQKVKEAIIDNKILIYPESHREHVLELLNKDRCEDLEIAYKKTEFSRRCCVLPFNEDFSVTRWLIECLNNQYMGIYKKTEGGSSAYNISHVIDYEDLIFHAVQWPALMFALGLPLPCEILVHGYIIDRVRKTDDISEISSIHKFVSSVGQDCFRYFLLKEFRLGDNGTISLNRISIRKKEFTSRVEDVFNDLIGVVIDECGGRIPVPKNISEIKSSLEKQLDLMVKKYQKYMETLEFDKALDMLLHYSEDIKKDAQCVLHQPIDTINRKQILSTLYDCLEGMRIVSLLIGPMLPEFSNKVHRALGIPFDCELATSLQKGCQWGQLRPGFVSRQPCDSANV